MLLLFFFTYPATTEIYTYRHTLSLHDALPFSVKGPTAEYSLSPAQWKTAHGTHRFPTQRQDSAGRARQPFTLQWAGELSSVRAHLNAAGWQARKSVG